MTLDMYLSLVGEDSKASFLILTESFRSGERPSTVGMYGQFHKPLHSLLHRWRRNSELSELRPYNKV